jgi:hypothetical protein
MTRLSQPPRSAFTDEADLAAYDAVTGRMRTLYGMQDDPELGAPNIGDYFGALLNAPTLTAIAAQMGTFVRTAGEREGTYTHAQREFVDQVLSKDWKTNVVQGLHVKDAVGAGVRLEAIEAIRYGREEELDDEERLLATYIRKAVSGTVDQETFDAVRELLGDRGIVEYTGFILWLQWIIRMMQALDTPAPTEEEVDAEIAGLRAGTVKVDDWRDRLG